MQTIPEYLATARLKLRPPEAFDAASIFQAYTQDADVCRYMIWTPHASLDITTEFIASQINAWSAEKTRPYILTERDSNDAIGMVEARLIGTTVELGYVLAKTHWGKGFMPEAVRAMTEAVLATDQFYRAQATCDTDNIPSQRTLEKSGFVREGRMDRYTVLPNISAEPRASFMYAKCR